MVVTLRPATVDSGVTQERMALPSRWTVHAPQSAIPQPNLVPGRPAISRTAHSRGMLGSASNVVDLPLSTNVVDMNGSAGYPDLFSNDSTKFHRHALACVPLRIGWWEEIARSEICQISGLRSHPSTGQELSSLRPQDDIKQTQSSDRFSPGKRASLKPNWVRSRMRRGYRIPSRWSTSCCTTRA